MKVESISADSEKTILVGMITDDQVMAKISSVWVKNHFRSRAANLIGAWCIEYHRKYGKAPGRAVERMFRVWSKGRKTELVDPIERLLSSLSDAYRKENSGLNSAFVIDAAENHFNRVRLERAAEEIQTLLEKDQIDKAEEVITGYRRLNVGASARDALFNNRESVSLSFAQAMEGLIRFPGAMGRMLQSEFRRDSFIAFMGPEKSGKTFMLIDVAWRALLQRKRVAFFEVGDMSKEQVSLRFLSRASGIPYRSPNGQCPFKIKRPHVLKFGTDGAASVEGKYITYKSELTEDVAWQSCVKLMKYRVRSQKPYFYLSCHPNNTMSVMDVRSELMKWAKEDEWVPDVVIIDYADILAPPKGIKEGREQINTTWKQLRALSQELHCCLVTATQSDRASYKSQTVQRWNTSEDKRKLAHATGILGISATDEEREHDIRRLNWVVRREGSFTSSRCLYLAGCLATASPAMVSAFPRFKRRAESEEDQE